jgi:hypothetical protein
MPWASWAIHETVHNEAVIRACKKLRELHPPNGVPVAEILGAFVKLVILRHCATGRQLPPQRRYILQPPPQLDLGLEKSIAGVAVLHAFSRKPFGMQ